MTLRAVIADDEPLLRFNLRQQLGDIWPELDIVGLAKDGDDAWALIQAHRPEVVILDIRMPGLSGLDVARRMQEEGMTSQCAVVFLTAYDQHAIEAFEREAIDYLLKPLDTGRLEKTRDRVEARLKASSVPVSGDSDALLRTLQQLQEHRQGLTRLTVSKGQSVHVIPVQDVLYFQADDKYTTVVTESGSYLIRTSLTDLENRLPPDAFWRIHRSYLARAARIDRVETDPQAQKRAILRGLEHPLPVSRRFARSFRPM